MTKINTSTQNVLAEITAQNARKTSTSARPAAIHNVTEAGTLFTGHKPKQNPALKKSSKAKAKVKVKAKFGEPNITRREGRDGAVSYMVQIRRWVDEKLHSLGRTVRHLPNAKNGVTRNCWRLK